MKVSKKNQKNQKSQKQRKREQARRTLLQGSPTTRVPQSSLKMPKTIVPDACDGWEEIEFALDFGATETVLGENMLSSVEIKVGAASKRSWSTRLRPGFQADSQEGVTRSRTAQVCAVNKALMSVQKVMWAVNRVVFDEVGTYIEDKVTWGKIWATDMAGCSW